MFKKKPNIKPLAPLRSSDRRRLADEIIRAFNVPVPEEASNQPDDGKTGPEKEATLSSIRNALLPENVMSARFTTTVGQDLKQVSGTVYAGAHSNEGSRILWLRIQDRLIPTVYSLWRHPNLVPILQTPDFVVQKLQNGAPLMIPGLANGPPFPPRATKGAVAAVASVERPTVPLVIGMCDIDIFALGQVQGAKGHAFESEHWCGDEVWAWSADGKSGTQPPESLVVSDVQNSAVGDLSNGLKDVQLDSSKSHAVLSSDTSVEGKDREPTEIDYAEAEPDMSTKEIDDAFWQAFLYGLYTLRKKSPENPAQSLNFPVSQSSVISQLVLPYLPASTTKQAASLSIKQTSWKNAKKFIKALDKAKLLRSKDRDGGECVVLSFSFDSLFVTDFSPYRLPQSTADSSGAKSQQRSARTCSGQSPKLQRLLLLRPNSKIAPLFEATKADVKHLFPPSELSSIVNSYIDAEKLLSPTNKRIVKINPFLANNVFDNGPQTVSSGKSRPTQDQDIIAKGSVPRDVLFECIQQHCTPHCIILRDGQARGDPGLKVHTGAPQIQVVLETRSGNKTATRVYGLEQYYVEPSLLAEELQKTCASSTSVTQMIGSSPKNPVMEVMIQGPQKDAVLKALNKRGVKKEWVDVLDKTKGKKR